MSVRSFKAHANNNEGVNQDSENKQELCKRWENWRVGLDVKSIAFVEKGVAGGLPVTLLLSWHGRRPGYVWMNLTEGNWEQMASKRKGPWLLWKWGWEQLWIKCTLPGCSPSRPDFIVWMFQDSLVTSLFLGLLASHSTHEHGRMERSLVWNKIYHSECLWIWAALVPGPPSSSPLK